MTSLFPTEEGLAANDHELARHRLRQYGEMCGSIGAGITQENIERLLVEGTGEEILSCLLRARKTYKASWPRWTKLHGKKEGER